MNFPRWLQILLSLLAGLLVGLCFLLMGLALYEEQLQRQLSFRIRSSQLITLPEFYGIGRGVLSPSQT